jgi:hypothetical protein
MSIALSRGGRFLGRAPALNVSWRRTLIRPPLVKGQSGPVAGTIARVPQDTTMGLANAADFISTAASDSVVCTKHLLRLELETTTRCRPQRGERQRLRGLETHLCPLAGRLKAAGSGRRPVPVSTQLGRGAAHSWSSQHRVIKSVERARESNQRTGLRELGAQMLTRGRGRKTIWSIGSGSVP